MILIITLLVAGAVLMFLEVFLPGLIAGIIGVLCWVAAVIIGYNQYGAETGHLLLSGVLAGFCIGGVCWLRFFPDSVVAKRFTSRSTVGELGVDKPELLQCKGVAATQLRPCGTAVINGKRVDVITEGSLIEKGTPIVVVAIEGMRVVVREV